MKKINTVALVLSIFLVVACGADEKKKKNQDLVISGVVTPNCVPTTVDGQQVPREVYMAVTQKCSAERSSPLFMQRAQAGIPISFSATYTLPQNPYGYAGQSQGAYFTGQQPVQMIVTGVQWH